MLNVSIMPADELIRYANPSSELEKSLYEKLKEQLEDNALSESEAATQLDEMDDKIQKELRKLDRAIDDLDSFLDTEPNQDIEAVLDKLRDVCENLEGIL